MNFKVINGENPRTYAIILDKGDEVATCLKDFAKQEEINAAHFSAIGAFIKVKVGFFDFSMKDYHPIYINEQTEVLNMSGDIALYKNEPVIHAHVVVGKKDGTAHGGHLLEAIVNPTLEIILLASPGYLTRRMNKELGIPLIDIQ